jgi:hypothetical protein
MSGINIYDLYRNIQMKKQKRFVSYDKVFERCCHRIQQAAENEQMKVLFEIPEFIMGLPIYDITKCTAYIMTKLRNSGFFVNYFFPRILYISWDIKEVKAVNHELARSLTMKDELEELVPPFKPHQALPPAPSQPLLLPPERRRLTDAAAPPQHHSLDSMIVPRTQLPAGLTRYKPSGKFVLNLS